MSFTKKIVIAAAALSTAVSALPSRQILPRAVAIENGFPKTGGQELPLTDADLAKVVLVTIGRGVQNYTCPPGEAKPVQTPPNGGAVAQLFDVTDIMGDSQHFADVLTDVAVRNPRPTLDDVPDDGTELGPLNDQFRKVCFHHFNEKGVPIFDCGEKGIIFGKKVANVDAPATAQTSANGAKAVPWLLLDAVEGSEKFTRIIRIVTAGGSPPASCAGHSPNEVISVDYAAQYWMFS